MLRDRRADDSAAQKHSTASKQEQGCPARVDELGAKADPGRTRTLPTEGQTCRGWAREPEIGAANMSIVTAPGMSSIEPGPEATQGASAGGSSSRRQG